MTDEGEITSLADLASLLERLGPGLSSVFRGVREVDHVLIPSIDQVDTVVRSPVTLPPLSRRPGLPAPAYIPRRAGRKPRVRSSLVLPEWLTAHGATRVARIR